MAGDVVPETPAVVYGSVEGILGAAKGIEPLEEDFVGRIGAQEFRFKIRGLKYVQDSVDVAQAANKILERIKKGLIPIVDARGEKFVPSEQLVQNAIYCSRCVIEPKLSEIQWIAVGAHSFIVGQLADRAVVCSRLVAAAETPGVLAAAEEALEMDPLDVSGSGSA